MSHDRQRTRVWVPLVSAVLLLVLGAAVAAGVGAGLGLSFTPLPAAPAAPAPGPVAPMAAAPAIRSIAVPSGHRYELAAAAVADAAFARTGDRPTVVTSDATDQGADVSVRLVPPFGTSSESFRVTSAAATPLTVEAGDIAGAVAGLYALADRIRTGTQVPGDGKVEQPRLGLRLTDAGSVGREPAPEAFAAGTDYSLNTDIVAGAALPEAPWVSADAVARIAGEFRQFVDHAVGQGYNGVVVPGFLEYVTFAGTGVYPDGDPHIARARAMVDAFAPVFRYADEMGLRVYLLTDMLAVSPLLESYLDSRFGGLAVERPEFWSVYQQGLAELFDRMPFADGLMVRVGEGGAVYQAGWDYSSRLAVTSPAAVHAMLRAFLDVAGQHDRDIIFRSWTVGVGAVGDLHTNPDSYATVLGQFDDPHLVVSTKVVAGDFYRHLPLNPTLFGGAQRRIVEFQARREFEGFGALPNNLLPDEAQALRQLLAANPHIEGVWNWTQDGGPLRAGPMSLYLRTGFWQLYDLNTYGLARLAWEPGTDPTQLTADWVRRSLATDASTVDAVTAALGLSGSAISDGLYIGPYARNAVKALGLEPPPMMWIFEWDIVTGDSAALDSIYAVSRDDLEEAIAEGERAIGTVQRMRDLVAGTGAGQWTDQVPRQSLVDALDYEVNLFATLGAYRSMVLRHVQWLDTGSDDAYDAWQAATARYQVARDEHVRWYTGDLDHPAYNFTAADLGAVRADRDPAMAWFARALLVVVLGLLLLGAVPRWLRGRPGADALRALWIGATRPWRLVDLTNPISPASRIDRVLVWLIPAAVLVLSRAVLTWFAAPAHLVVTLGGWLLFTVMARLLIGRRDPFVLYAAIGGVALLRTVILLIALAARGPGRYWLHFWTDPVDRSVYITVAFAAFAWLFVATALVLRQRYGLLRRRAVGATLVAVGVSLALLAGMVAVIGLERALTIWNDQLALLPWGLSRILGITVYLGIPPETAAVATGFGVALTAIGALVCLGRRSTVDGGAQTTSG